jgi:hypothetical protein
VAGKATTEPHPDITERKVKFVVEDQHPLKGDTKRAACRADCFT